jgi:hypothetical protein
MNRKHAAPRNPARIGDRLTVAAVHLILGLPRPVATDAGQPGRHHLEAAR